VFRRHGIHDGMHDITGTEVGSICQEEKVPGFRARHYSSHARAFIQHLRILPEKPDETILLRRGG
jgi:hypothetical protein